MSRVLSEFLGASEPMFTNLLKRLETESGHPNTDVRLIADISKNTYRKIRELGLDPNDTNGLELYHALQDLMKKHDEFIVKAIGGSDALDTKDLIPRIVKRAKTLPVPKTCWAIKHSSAKRLLKSMPPKKVMKLLGYRSIDSMLKREKIDEIYAAIRFVESSSWLNRFINTYKKLKPTDFETRKIAIIEMPAKRWAVSAEDFIYNKHHNVVALKEMGIVAVLPLSLDKLRGSSLTTLLLIVHYINEIRLYSAYFKLQQVKPNFANTLANTLIKDPKHMFTIAGQPLHWRAIQQHYGKESKAKHPEIFEPHVQPEDLEWKSAGEVLYKIEPALKFWEGLDYSALISNRGIVPLGLMDNAVNFCNELEYGNHSVGYFQSNLWNELLARYLGEKELEEQFIKQLDNEVSEPSFTLIDIRGIA